MSELVGQALGRYRLVAGQVEAMHIWCKTLPDGTAMLGGAPFNVARHLRPSGSILWTDKERDTPLGQSLRL